MASDYLAIKDLAAVKQKELQDLHAQSLLALEEQLQAKEAELQNLQCMFNQLKQDFKYNLQLLHERDAELEQQDPAITDLRLTVSKQSGEISELSIRVDQLKDTLSQETLAKRELSSALLRKLDLLRAEHDAELRAKEAELVREQAEQARVRRDYECQLALVRDELQSEQHASAKRIDELARRLQHDSEREKEEASCSVLALQLQVKMLTRELEMVAQARKSDEDEKQTIQASLDEAKKKIKDLEWQIEDGQAELAFSVKSLQTSLRNAEAQLDLQSDEMHKKIAELDRQNSEKAAVISSLKQARDSNESELQARLYELCQKVAMADARLKEAQESATRLVSQKDEELQSLGKQLEDLKAAHARDVQQLNYAAASDKAEVLQLCEANETFAKDADSRKRDLERYRKDLIAAVDRATQLEREKAQMSIDWQKQAQALERTRIHEMEQFVSSLTKAKDDALAKVKRQEEQLASLRRVVDSRQMQYLSLDNAVNDKPAVASVVAGSYKDAARKLLSCSPVKPGRVGDHSLRLAALDKDLDDGRGAADSAAENASLREQNESLRLVIRQMRQEMEMLVQQVDPSSGPQASSSLTVPRAATQSDGRPLGDDYTRTLEEEVRNLKATIRHLQVLVSSQPSQQQQEAMVVAGSTSGGGSSARNLHVQALNETIGMLRSEKVALQAQARKMQVRVDALTAELDKTKQEPAKKQVMVEQLQYELHASERRRAADGGSLRQRVAGLELQLAEVQQEADEYYKSLLEKNAQLTALESQLSELKLADSDQSAAGRRRVNYGAQELLIQQLQDEVARLRDLLAGRRSGANPDAGEQAAVSASVPAAQAAEKGLDSLFELRAAQRQVAQLSKEKAVLTELSNRLRAELKKAGLPSVKPAWSGSAQAAASAAAGARKPQGVMMAVAAEPMRPGEVTSRVEDRLRLMENLQYRQTMSELSRSPRRRHPEPWLSMAEVEAEVESGKVIRGATQQSSTPRLTDMLPERDVQPAITAASFGTAQDMRTSIDRHNMERVTARSQSQSQPALPIENSPLYSSSSLDGGGSSLQDVWRMLDESNSFADTPAVPLASSLRMKNEDAYAGASDTAIKKDTRDEFVVFGSKNTAGLRRSTAASALPSQLQQKDVRARQKVAGSKTKAKIRNYNIKD